MNILSVVAMVLALVTFIGVGAVAYVSAKAGTHIVIYRLVNQK